MDTTRQFRMGITASRAIADTTRTTNQRLCNHLKTSPLTKHLQVIFRHIKVRTATINHLILNTLSINGIKQRQRLLDIFQQQADPRATIQVINSDLALDQFNINMASRSISSHKHLSINNSNCNKRAATPSMDLQVNLVLR